MTLACSESVSSGYVTRTGLSNIRDFYCYFFQENFVWFFYDAVLTFPPTMKGSLGFTSSPTPAVFHLFGKSHLNTCEVRSCCRSPCTFPIWCRTFCILVDDLHILRNVYSSLVSIFYTQLFVFLLLNSVSFWIRIANPFSHPVCCFFTCCSFLWLCGSFSLCCFPLVFFLLSLPVFWIHIPEHYHSDKCPKAFLFVSF